MTNKKYNNTHTCLAYFIVLLNVPHVIHFGIRSLNLIEVTFSWCLVLNCVTAIKLLARNLTLKSLIVIPMIKENSSFWNGIFEQCKFSASSVKSVDGFNKYYSSNDNSGHQPGASIYNLLAPE